MARRSSIATAANATLRRAVIGAFNRVRGELWSTSDFGAPSRCPPPPGSSWRTDLSAVPTTVLTAPGATLAAIRNTTGGVDGDLVDDVAHHRGHAGHPGRG